MSQAFPNQRSDGTLAESEPQPVYVPKERCLSAASVLHLRQLLRREVNYSSQLRRQIVDCLTYKGKADQGCNGGEITDALEYVVTHGLVAEATYPYEPEVSWLPLPSIAQRSPCTCSNDRAWVKTLPLCVLRAACCVSLAVCCVLRASSFVPRVACYRCGWKGNGAVLISSLFLSQTGKCDQAKSNRSLDAVQLKGYYNVTVNNGTALLAAASMQVSAGRYVSLWHRYRPAEAQHRSPTVCPGCGLPLLVAAPQPVSVAIDASCDDFMNYNEGVFDLSCGTELDHGVLVTGFYLDKQGNGGFWRVKNSWGGGWGEDGYIRMDMQLRPGEKGCCGINMQPSAPVGAVMSPDYKPPTECGVSGGASCLAGTVCCCAKQGFLGCKDWQCCSQGDTCVKDQGCTPSA